MRLPDYFNYFSAIYPQVVVEALVSIESSFQLVNYNKHLDMVDAIFQKEGVEELRSLCDKALDVIRNHVTDCFHMQGVTLTNGDETPIVLLAQMLNGLVALATKNLLEILEGDKIDEGDSDVEFVCNALSITTNIPAVQLLFYIDSVDEHLVEVLKAGETTEEVHHVNNTESMERFIRYYDGESSIVVDAIRSLNYFGYDAKTVLDIVDEKLDDLKDPEEIRRELILLVAGSSLKDSEAIRDFLDQTVESVFGGTAFSTQLILKINAGWPDFEEFAL